MTVEELFVDAAVVVIMAQQAYEIKALTKQQLYSVTNAQYEDDREAWGKEEARTIRVREHNAASAQIRIAQEWVKKANRDYSEAKRALRAKVLGDSA